MSKISINLLPPEIIAKELKKAKFYKIQAIGVVIILLMTFLTSLTIALRVLQNHNLSVVQAKLAQAEQRVSSLKSTESSLFLLKDRMTAINQYLGVSSAQSAMYRLINKLTPSSVSINAFTVSAGSMTLLVSVPDAATLDTLINSLLDKELNEGKIKQVSMEGLTRGKDGLYRVNLKLE